MKVNLSKYKGAIIEYCCTICNIFDNFFEDFNNEISKIKSCSCNHFDVKFIFKLGKKKFEYILSFNCKKCGENELVNLYNNDDDFFNINYKCKRCKNGDFNVQMILSEDIIKDDNPNIEKREKPNEIKQIDKNNNILNAQNNNMNNEITNNMNLIGGNANHINNNNFNFNNNFMRNDIFIGNNPNLMNMNFFNNDIINNMDQNVDQINMMIGKMNINNNNQNNIQNINKYKNNSIKLIFKDTKGLFYELYVSSLDLVFSEVVRQLFKKYSEFNEDKEFTFFSNAERIQNYKTLRENNLNNESIIMIFEK